MEVFNKEEIILGRTFYLDTKRYHGTKKDVTIKALDHYWPILKERLYEIYRTKYPNHLEDLDDIKYEVSIDDVAPSSAKYNFSFNVFNNKHQALMGFNMAESGNCCGSMFVHGIELYHPGLQCKGLGKIMLAMVEDIAIAQDSYNLLGINVAGRNFNKHLENRNFIVINKFCNENSGNYCYIFSKELKGFDQRDIKLEKLI